MVAPDQTKVNPLFLSSNSIRQTLFSSLALPFFRCNQEYHPCGRSTNLLLSKTRPLILDHHEKKTVFCCNQQGRAVVCKMYACCVSFLVAFPFTFHRRFQSTQRFASKMEILKCVRKNRKILH